MHSFIIPIFQARSKKGQSPPYDWLGALSVCVRSIRLSAKECGGTDYEILIVSGDLSNGYPSGCRGIVLPELPAKFNKPALNNMGVEESRGDTLSFLDADVIVGKRFFDTLADLSDPTLTKVCYRVKELPQDKTREHFCDDSSIGAAFGIYDSLPHKAEAYGKPHLTKAKVSDTVPVYGNSQFSITREKLGAMRWRKDCLDGRIEDIIFNLDLAAAHGASYRAKIFTDADHALLTFHHPRSPVWNRNQTENNHKKYHRLLRRAELK